jgi:hypothetical protein
LILEFYILVRNFMGDRDEAVNVDEIHVQISATPFRIRPSPPGALEYRRFDRLMGAPWRGAFHARIRGQAGRGFSAYEHNGVHS